MRPRLTLAALLLASLIGIQAIDSAAASDAVPKQVHLIEDHGRLVASNVRFSRFDTLKLDARERILEKAEGEAVIIVITDQRVIAYGVLSGWRPIPRMAGEGVESVTAEDFAALVVTSRRLLNFNGESGVWGESTRRVSR